MLVEIHSHYLQQVEIARRVDWVYDFALPPLMLHSLFSRDFGLLSTGCEFVPTTRSQCSTRTMVSESLMSAQAVRESRAF